MKQTVLIIDGDLTAYQAAAVVEKRTVNVIHKRSQRSKVFKTRTEFKKFLKDTGKEYKEGAYEFVDIQEAAPLSHACKIVKNMVVSLTAKLKATMTEVWIGDNASNFRNFLELPEKYKGNRDDMLRPLLLKETKQYLTDNNQGGVIKDIEADDQIIIRWFELKEEGHKPIVLSRDKDSKGCVGITLCNPDNEEVVEIPAFGYIRYNAEKKKIEAIGLHNYCYQLLHGDPSDNYAPSDLHKKKFGDKSILKLLEPCKNVDELFQAVEDKYKEWFPEPLTYTTWDGKEVTKDYKQILELYHSCVYMKRKKDDPTTFYSLWEEFKNDN